MERCAKVRLFEQMRREYEHGVGTIVGVAKKFGVHRRMVRDALRSAMPPERKPTPRESPKLGPVRDFIDAILDADRHEPRKQRHTARRIRDRLRERYPNHEVGESTVRRYVSRRKRELGLKHAEVFIPQSYVWGDEAQVDWYESHARIGGELTKVHTLVVRSMAGGGAFHRGYPRATQQAFFEAQEKAFEFFGGVFRRMRYDNLTLAVRKILRGYQRHQTERFVAFRSHWGFDSEFCNPSRGNEKGGVESEVGYFRRNLCPSGQNIRTPSGSAVCKCSPCPSCPKTQTNSRLARRAVSIVIDPWRAPDLGRVGGDVGDSGSPYAHGKHRSATRCHAPGWRPGSRPRAAPGPERASRLRHGSPGLNSGPLGWPLFRRCTARSVPVLLLGANVALENRD